MDKSIAERIAILETQRTDATADMAEIKQLLRDHIKADSDIQVLISAKLTKIDRQTAYDSGFAAQRKQILVGVGGLIVAVISGGGIFKLLSHLGWIK